MKTLYLIGGPMGVGKTTVGQELKRRLDKSVFLDGDWCWDAHPFQVTGETKAMVMDNICHLLNNFLHCGAYEKVIFSWVMDRKEILEELLGRLDTGGCEVKCLSLVCTQETLIQRLEEDIRAGRRELEVIERSLGRLPLYEELETRKVDTTDLTAAQVAEAILRL